MESVVIIYSTTSFLYDIRYLEVIYKVGSKQQLLTIIDSWIIINRGIKLKTWMKQAFNCNGLRTRVGDSVTCLFIFVM